MAGNSISIIIRAQNNASGDLNDIRIDIERLDRAAGNASGGMGRLGGVMRTMGGVAAAAAVGITAAVTGLAALGAGSLQAGGNFEEAMNEFSAVKGLDQTSEAFQEARAAAIEMGTTTKFSATEAASALTFLGRAGFSSADAVSSLPGVLNLAAASGMDLASTADIASNILSGFGLEISQLGELNDVLAATAANANVDVRMLGETFKYAGPIAKGAGLSLEQTAAAIGKLGDAGIQGSAAGTALRAGLLKLQAPSEKAKGVLDRLGVTVLDSEGNLRDFVDIMQDMNAAGARVTDWTDLVGVEAATAFDLLTTNADGLADLATGLEDVDGASQNMADTMNKGFNAAVKGLGSAFEGLQIAIFDAGLGEMATMLVNDLSNAIRGLATNEVFLQAITNAFQIFINQLRAAQQFVASVMQVWNSVFTNEAASIEASTNQWVQTTVQILLALRSAFQSISEFFTMVFARLRGDTETGASEIGSALETWVSITVTVLQGLQVAFQTFVTFWAEVFNRLRGVTTSETTAVDSRMNAWVTNTAAIINQFQNIFSSVASFISNIFARMRGDVDAGANSMGATMNTFVTVISTVLMALQQAFGGAFSFIQERFQAFIDVFTSSTGVFDYFNRLAAFMTETQQEIAAGLRSWVAGAISTAFNFYIEKIREAGTNAQAAFREWMGQIGGVFANLAQQAQNWGASITQGIVTGIRNLIPNALSEIQGLADQLGARFRSVLGISSPSKIFEGYGFNMIEGAIVGIRANAAAAIGEVEGLANQIEAVLRNSLETTRNYVSAISLGVQAGLQSASDAIPQLQAQADELRTRLQGLANEDGTFVGLSEDQLQLAQTIGQQYQNVQGTLQSYQSQVDQAAQANARATAEQQRLAQSTADARYQYERTAGVIGDDAHLNNLRQQAELINQTEGATVEYYNTLTEVARMEQQQAAAAEQAAQQRQQAAQQAAKQRSDDWQKRMQEEARAREQAAREAEQAERERQRAAEELNKTMMQQAENVYMSQVISGMIAFSDQIARVEGQLASAEKGTNEWLALFRELQTLRGEEESNLFELQFVEGDYSAIEELEMRLERTRETLEGLQNQRGSGAYLSAAQEELKLEQAITEELERQRQSRLDSLRIDADRERRRAEARTPVARANDPDQQPHIAANIQRSQGAFTGLADAIQKTTAAGYFITDNFFEYLASQRFSRDVTGGVVNLTESLMSLGEASRGDLRTALEVQKSQLQELLAVLPQGSDQWFKYAAALAAVNRELQGMNTEDRASEVAGLMNSIGQTQVDLGVRTGEISPEQARDFYAAEEQRFSEARGESETFEENVAFTEAMLAARDKVAYFNEQLDVTTPMDMLKENLLGLATDNIPMLSGVISGFATGGPLGALISLFTQLASKGEGLARIGEMVMKFFEPIVAMLDQLFVALEPLVAAVLDLFLALMPITEIVIKILKPVFLLLGKVVGVLANIIMAVVNGFVAVYNALLGWLLGRIKKVSRTDYSDNEEDEDSKDKDGGSQNDKNQTTDFGGVPPTVQLAIATPLVQAADKMLQAANLMVGALSGGVEGAARTTQTGNNLSLLLERHAAAMSRHATSLDAASTVLDRLVSEGVRVEAQSNVTVKDDRSSTLGLR